MRPRLPDHHTIAYQHSDNDAHGDCNPEPVSNADNHVHSHGERDADVNPVSYAVRHAIRDPNSHLHQHSYSNTIGDCVTDFYSHIDIDPI